MKFLDLTPPTPAENLALDEALLDACEAGEINDEVLRFWEPQQYFVVVGYANKIDLEVNRSECQRLRIPILRRCSGGGTVLQGPGCLNYTVILRITEQLQGIPQTNTYVMERNRAAVEKVIGQPVQIRGHTDLATGDLKFSGNAQRRKKNFLIFHGTFLLDFDLTLIEKVLRFPSKQPDYRNDRNHLTFVTNIHQPAAAVKNALTDVWQTASELPNVPDCRSLVAEKYGTTAWNEKF